MEEQYEPRTATEAYGLGQLRGPANVPMPGEVIVGIERVENGFMVAVGCKRFVGRDWDEVSFGLKMYYEDPKKAMKEYLRATV